MLRRARSWLLSRLAILRVGGYKEPPCVNGFTRFNGATTLGLNTHFNGLRVFGAGPVVIGDNFHSGSGCKIITQSHDYNADALPYGANYKEFSIRIGDNVWLGMDVTIVGNVSIGDGAIIQVGSVVVNDIPACAIAGGHPARVFAHRDRAHYDRLVAEKKFH